MTSVVTGSRLGPYEVVSRIGAGGMGEVFRARDTRLDRTVAIKVLPAEFANNAQLKIRFEREAKAISQISHPNICALHDVGNAAGVEYLVLEYLEGETLADRIERGPVPIADVLRFGSQIASALACAHRAGIIHRDLKPGNVMITKSGAKLLDFGLARSTPVLAGATDETQHKPLTQEGTILGTFQYMSPEQLTGEEVDSRTDIFALGAVLYEMLTGTRAFDGKSRTSIVTAVLTGLTRPASSLRPTTPPALEHVIAKCLAPERDDRWESTADVASELEWIATLGSGESAAVRASAPGRKGVWWTALALVAAVALAAIAGAAYFMRRVRSAEQPVRSELMTDEPLTPSLFGAIALSPDGTKLLALVGPEGRPSVAVRNLATGETKKLAGTEESIFPFWSPDSQQIGFFSGGKLRTIGVGGGTVQTICDAPQGRGGTWSKNGVIVFAPGLSGPLCKVNEGGGTPVPVTHNATPAETHRQPSFLPDGKTFLFALRMGNDDVIFAGSADGTLRKQIVNNASKGMYAHGRLFFVREGNLVSQAFDLAKLEVSGPVTPVAERVEYFKVRALGNFSVSDTKLVYVSEASRLSEIVVSDRSGRSTKTDAGPNRYRILDVSPDGKTLAVAINEHFDSGDVWLVPLGGGTKSRLTFAHTGGLSGAFSADGKWLATSTGFFGQTITVDLRSVVTNDVRKVLDVRTACIVGDWSHDGKYLLAVNQDTKTGFDIHKIDVAAKTMTPIVHGPADELAPTLSPDGKWLAFVSTESGAPDVYVTAFPSGEGKWQATQEGGTAPRWSRDGKELFYVKDGRLMAMDVHEGAVPQFGPPAALPVTVNSDRVFLNSYTAYAVTSDGRFVTTQPVGGGDPVIHLVSNWSAALNP